MTWLLSGLSLITLWLMGNKSKHAPLVGVLSQVVWFYYVFDTDQLGFLPGVIAYTVIHLRNSIKWYRESQIEGMTQVDAQRSFTHVRPDPKTDPPRERPT